MRYNLTMVSISKLGCHLETAIEVMLVKYIKRSKNKNSKEKQVV